MEMRNLVAGAVLLVLVGVLAAAYVLSTTPHMSLEPQVKAVGIATPVRVRVESPHGIRRVSAFLEQNGKRYSVFQATQPARWMPFFRATEAPKEFAFTAGKQQAPELK